MMNINDFLNSPEVTLLQNLIAPYHQDFRFIGGSVRDLLLEKTIQDIDMATTWLPEQVMEYFANKKVKAIPTGLQHGTITIILQGQAIEITTLRRDIACDGRHAVIAYTDSWEEDARRRDFTINAMSMDLEGNIYDYFNGKQDLQNGELRFVGKAKERIQEDYLRILRLFRFWSYYGKKALATDILTACKAYAHSLKELSKERIRQELWKILLSPKVIETFDIMHSYHLLAPLGLSASSALARLLAQDNKIGILPRLACVVTDENYSFALSNKEKKHLQLLLRTNIGSSTAEQKKLIVKYGKDLYYELMLIEAARKGLTEIDLDLYYNWEVPNFPLQGMDLIEAGFPPGPPLGKLLAYGFELWQKSDYSLNKEALITKILFPPHTK